MLSTPRQLSAGLLGLRRQEPRLRVGDFVEEVDCERPDPIMRVASHEQNYVEDGGSGIIGSLVSTYNLTSTILGAGILSIPFAMNECGLAMGLMLMAFTAVSSIMSCNLVLSCYLRTGKGSYGDLAMALFGSKCAAFVKWVIIVLNVGAASGYILVVKSLLPRSLCQLLGGDDSNAIFCESDEDSDTVALVVTAVIVFFVVFPLCCLENLSSLRYTSMLAFVFAMFLTTAIVIRSVEYNHFTNIKLWPTTPLGIFKALPVFCFSFVCHLNVLPVYDQLRSRTPTRMRNVFRNAITFALTIYSVSGSFGYLRFKDDVPDNILAFGYFATDDYLIAAARIAEALTCTLALPLIFHPTRVALHSWLFNISKELDNDAEQEAVENAVDNEGNEYGLLDTIDELPAEEAMIESPRMQCLPCCTSRRIRMSEAFSIVVMSFTLALLVPNISTVFGLLGSCCCSLVCFVFPGTFYLRSTKHVFFEFPVDRSYNRSEYNSLIRVIRQRRLAWIMIFFGVCIGVIGTAATAIKH
mmetsp:Transcript_36915/g.60037  ORF Transcript_36915/g.60037 Transcript_36915/m.60037 type:complete len:525 (+) Transcript_36915:1947-3521(+)